MLDDDNGSRPGPWDGVAHKLQTHGEKKKAASKIYNNYAINLWWYFKYVDNGIERQIVSIDVT